MSVMGLTHCTRSGSSNPGGAGGSGGNPGEPTSRFPQCYAAIDDLDPELLLTRALPPVGADGVEEVALSPKGCVRLVRRVSGGRVVDLSLRKALGFAHAGADAPSDVTEFELVLADWAFTATGSHGVFDNDEDGTPDAEIVEQFSDGKLTSQVISVTDEGTGQVIERRTLTAAGAGTMHFKHELAQDGALSVLTDKDFPALQKNDACYTHGSGTQTVACKPEQIQQIREAMRRGLARGLQCLAKHQGPLRDRHILTVMQQGMIDRMPITCVKGDEYAAAVDTGARDAEGLVPLYFNVESLGCEGNDFIDSTLFHEALHIGRGPHTEDGAIEKLPDGQMGLLSYTYTDSIRSCEALCFGTVETRCSCAKCLETKACDSRCSGYDTCVVSTPDKGYTMSEAVGAMCETDTPSWHKTMTACQSACSEPAKCKSMSLSCNKNCK